MAQPEDSYLSVFRHVSKTGIPLIGFAVPQTSFIIEREPATGEETPHPGTYLPLPAAKLVAAKILDLIRQIEGEESSRV